MLVSYSSSSSSSASSSTSSATSADDDDDDGVDTGVVAVASGGRHGGRVRRFAHAAGCFPTHVRIRFPPSVAKHLVKLSQTIASVVTRREQSVVAWSVVDEETEHHVSLCRCFPLPRAALESFTTEVTTTLSRTVPPSARSEGAAAVASSSGSRFQLSAPEKELRLFAAEKGLRRFIVWPLSAVSAVLNEHVLHCIRRIDPLVVAHGGDAYYTSPTPHISLVSGLQRHSATQRDMRWPVQRDGGDDDDTHEVEMAMDHSRSALRCALSTSSSEAAADHRMSVEISCGSCVSRIPI